MSSEVDEAELLRCRRQPLVLDETEDESIQNRCRNRKVDEDEEHRVGLYGSYG
jgi:hypothetical protein